MTDKIVDIWQEIYNWLCGHVPRPPETWGFLPAASEAQINQIGLETGCDIPDDLRQLLRIYHGQDMKSPLRWLPSAMNLLSCEKIIEIWHRGMTFYKTYGEGEFSQQTYFENQLRNIIDHPRRLTIAEQEGIATLILDGVPGPKGKNGQVIVNISECDFVVLAGSLTAFMKKYLQLMIDDQIYFDVETYSQMMPIQPDLTIEDLLIRMK
jgi:cell wall assembly regulator SMI1